MREITAELKELRLYGMAGAWVDLTAQGSVGIDTSRWLIEHLLQAEQADRAMRSVSYQLKSARFPVHRDLAGFDFSQSKVDERLRWRPGNTPGLLPRSPLASRRPLALTGLTLPSASRLARPVLIALRTAASDTPRCRA